MNLLLCTIWHQIGAYLGLYRIRQSFQHVFLKWICEHYSLLIINIVICDECIGLRFCDMAQNGNAHKHSKLIGLFNRTTDQQVKLPDKTSLVQFNTDSGNKHHTERSELSSKRLPLEVCFIDFFEAALWILMYSCVTVVVP